MLVAEEYAEFLWAPSKPKRTRKKSWYKTKKYKNITVYCSSSISDEAFELALESMEKYKLVVVLEHCSFNGTEVENYKKDFISSEFETQIYDAQHSTVDDSICHMEWTRDADKESVSLSKKVSLQSPLSIINTNKENLSVQNYASKMTEMDTGEGRCVLH